MLPIKQNLTTINYNGSSNKTNKYIVVHYTANITDTAYNNTKYFKSVNRNASSHYFVDDNNIYQCVLDKDIAWHCGGKKLNGNGGSFYGKCTNANSIGVEMCCTNSDVSAKTEANTIELVKYLMSKYNIPVSNVIRHYDVTGKNCPKTMVENSARWNNFKAKLGGQASFTAVASKPSNSTYIGGSIVDYLNSIGVDSSFNNRSKLAKQNGIKGYTGTASQNTALLNKLRGGGTTTVQSNNYYAKYNGSSGSLVDALKSLNINSSFGNRRIIAKSNGINVYLGTSNQNTTLLNLLKQGRLKK